MKYLLISAAMVLFALGCRSGKNTTSTEQGGWESWRNPDWLQQEISHWEEEGIQNPPIQINLYQFREDTVVHISAPCCDQFSRLLDMEGTLICHPDGGITGRGDGKCPDFVDQATWLFLLYSQTSPEH